MAKYNKIRKNGLDLNIFNPNYTLFNEIVNFLKRFSKSETILDYGAGNMPYRTLFKSNKYYSVDIEQNEDSSIDLVIEPNQKMPVNDKYDLVLLLDVLEHTEEPYKVLIDLHSKISKDGTLLLSIPFMYREHEMPYDFARYSSSGIKVILEKCGYENIIINKVGNRYYTLYSLWNESLIFNGEINRNIFGKIIRRLFSLMIVPILNLSLFKFKNRNDVSIYHHLLVECTKK